MDQDSFRLLLSSGSGSGSGSSSSNNKSRPAVVSKQTRGSLFKDTKGSSSSSTKPDDEASSGFKPRKVKKSNDRYRDRAAERRTGQGNDYADVESVLEDFEKRTADQDKDVVDEQRRYLGGDSEHTVLVKGLDMALLQANKAKAAQSTEEDEDLEDAYMQVAAPAASDSTSVPKKRTREDIIRELKGKRSGGGETETATVDKGKFKPIGFKPVGAPAEKEGKKKKKAKGEGDGERKKKKRKVESEKEVEALTNEKEKGQLPSPTPAKQEAPQPKPQKKIEPEPPEDDEDVDIFAGAGDYEGVDVGDDEDENAAEEPGEYNVEPSVAPGNWFKMDDDPEPVAGPPKPEPTPESRPTKSSASAPVEEDGEASGDEQPMRLVPLSGSALPSIKDFLAMDEAAETAEKKRKRKEKRKGIKGDDDSKKQLSAEAKANRDYQKLQSYTSKS